MKGVAIALLFSACLAAQQSGIDGVVVQSVTRQPLSGVHIRLLFIDPNQRDGPAGVYGAMSDRAGHFSIAGMPPGSYLLMCERTGFVHISSAESIVGAPAISLKSGQQMSGYSIEMAPVAIIAGRVLDEFGDPIPNVIVNAVPVSGTQVHRASLRPVVFTSDDRGAYRIATSPGKYYVQAQPRNFGPAAMTEIRTDGSSDASYGPTFFPNTAVKDRGAVVDAAAGREISGVDIHLVRLKMLSVSGLVSGMPDGPNRAQVMLIALDRGGSRGTSVGPDGRFSLPRVEAGKYRVSARFGDLESQQTEFTLEGADVTGIELRLSPGDDLAGTFEIAGAALDPGRKWVIRLNGLTGRSFTGETDRSGAFRVPSVTPGRFRVTVDGMPEDAYIASVQLDGADVPDRVLDLGRGARGSRIKVTLGKNGARITGKVLDPDGQPITNAMAFVLLTNDPKTLLSSEPPRAAADGAFAIKAIRPGKYRFFAVNIFDLTGDPENTIKALYERAPEIEIREGDRLTKDVRVAGKEAANGK